jgi:hypothetical protein
MAHKKIKKDSVATAGDHPLTSTIRDIVEHPENHTVGALAAAVDQALSELMMFRDRLDLLDDKDAGKAKGPTGSAPAATTSPEASRSRRAS